ncbi:MAG: hypothetical protein ABJ327_13140 [Litoreibacter sp.]
MPHLTFIIPVRHPDNSSDWAMQCAFLSATAASIAAQVEPGWAGVVVANHGSDLPDLPAGFTVEWVDFKPNPAYSIAQHGKDAARDAFRLDKGRRVLAGMLSARDSGHFMIVDDDDFVTRDLSGFVKANSQVPGWFIDTGFGWTEGSDYCVHMSGYSGVCGSSLIIRGDLYDLPESLAVADEDYIKDWLGSHVRIKGILQAKGAPLVALPFDGGVYRVGHPNSHSNSGNVWQYFFLHPKYLAKPGKFFRNMRGIRKLNTTLRQTFFGKFADAEAMKSPPT